MLDVWGRDITAEVSNQSRDCRLKFAVIFSHLFASDMGKTSKDKACTAEKGNLMNREMHTIVLRKNKDIEPVLRSNSFN